MRLEAQPMADDIVAELDHWLRQGVPLPSQLVQHARALASQRLRESWVRDNCTPSLSRQFAAKARAEALAECMRACPACADRIRALKDGAE